MYLKQDNNINQVAHGRLGRGQPPELTTIQICNVCKAVFSVFYSISKPNCEILTNFMMLFPAVLLDFVLLAQVK